MKKIFAYSLLLISLPFLQNCSPDQANASSKRNTLKVESKGITIENKIPQHKDFGDHWYQGLAELTSYKLEQSRYGEIHEGHAVLVFVTEDFLKNKQVKFEGRQEANDEVVKVLKLNFTRKFNTGVYPYSLMTSTFSPIQADKPLKISSTMQEWCGQTFMQINQKSDGFNGVSHSYFQSEADTKLSLPKEVFFEDDLWIWLRKDPKSLPTGNIQVVPGMQFLRMSHREAKTYEANAKLADGVYTVNYPSLGRTLKINFSSKFPFEINSWTESDSRLTTKATKIESIMLDYWSRNGLNDKVYREKLGLK
jgi:hypothetical protein